MPTEDLAVQGEIDRLPFSLNGKEYEDKFIVCKDLEQECILGCKFLYDNKICLNFRGAFECIDTQVNTIMVDGKQVKHAVITEDSPPIAIRPYRLAFQEEQAVHDVIKEYLVNGVIRPSTSPWRSALVPIKKPDGSVRLCVDYRPLNAITKVDRYPLP